MKTQYTIFFMFIAIAPSMALMSPPRRLTPAQVIEEKQAEIARLSPLVAADYEAMQERRRELQNITDPEKETEITTLISQLEQAYKSRGTDLSVKAEELASLIRDHEFRTQERATPHSPLQSHILGQTAVPAHADLMRAVHDHHREALARLDAETNQRLASLAERRALVDRANANNPENGLAGHTLLARMEQRIIAKYQADKHELISRLLEALSAVK